MTILALTTVLSSKIAFVNVEQSILFSHQVFTVTQYTCIRHFTIITLQKYLKMFFFRGFVNSTCLHKSIFDILQFCLFIRLHTYRNRNTFSILVLFRLWIWIVVSCCISSIGITIAPTQPYIRRLRFVRKNCNWCSGYGTLFHCINQTVYIDSHSFYQLIPCKRLII